MRGGYILKSKKCVANEHCTVHLNEHALHAHGYAMHDLASNKSSFPSIKFFFAYLHSHLNQNSWVRLGHFQN